MNLPKSVEELLKKEYTKDKEGNDVKIKALSTRNNLLAIQNIIGKHKPLHTLEIGLAFGASALLISELHKINAGNHTAIDPFQNKKWRGIGVNILKQNNCLNNFKYIEGYSNDILPQLVKLDKKFDFIYIDGSHVFEDVFIDFYYAFSLLTKNGIVLFDDSADTEVNKVISYIRKNYGSYMVELDGWSSLKYRIARKLNKVQLVGFQKTKDKDLIWGNSFNNF